jgi:hypothetical protein
MLNDKTGKQTKALSTASVVEQITRYVVLLLILVLGSAITEGQTARSNVSLGSRISEALLNQERVVQSRFPGAKLFQVFILDAVLQPTLQEEQSHAEVHSLYELAPNRTYVEVVDRIGTTNKTEVHTRAFGGRDCFYGHPQSERETCGPTVDPPATADSYLTRDWNFDLAKFATSLREQDLDTSRHFDLTIASAARMASSMEFLQSESSYSPEVIRQLTALAPTNPVIAITERSESHTQAGLTMFLDTTNHRFLGSTKSIRSNRLPPTR